MGFNGDVCRDLAAHFLALAEKRGRIVPLMLGHTVMGTSLTLMGDIVEGRKHFDRGMALYNPAEHRPLATRFGQDVEVAILAYRAIALWALGYPDAALADTERMLQDARAIRQAATLMFALVHASFTHLFCGNYARGIAITDECIALAEEKNPYYGKRVRLGLKAASLPLPTKPQMQSRRSPRRELVGGQRDQRRFCRRPSHICPKPMRTSANSITLGAALAQR